MKHTSLNHGLKIYIKCQENELTTKSLTIDPSYPMINNSAKVVILDLDQVQNVDATGVSWLLDFACKVSNFGAKLYLSDTGKVYEAVKFLGLDHLLRSTKELNTKKAI